MQGRYSFSLLRSRNWRGEGKGLHNSYNKHYILLYIGDTWYDLSQMIKYRSINWFNSKKFREN